MVETTQTQEKQPEEKRQVDIAELILENRKRTYHMFMEKDKDDVRPPEDVERLKMKLQVKINAQYSKIGEVPGITVDEFKRKKILKDLQQSIPQTDQITEIEKEQEES